MRLLFDKLFVPVKVIGILSGWVDHSVLDHWLVAHSTMELLAIVRSALTVSASFYYDPSASSHGPRAAKVRIHAVEVTNQFIETTLAISSLSRSTRHSLRLQEVVGRYKWILPLQ